MKASTKIVDNITKSNLTIVKSGPKLQHKNDATKKLNINTLEPNFSYLNNTGRLITKIKSVLL